MYVARSQLGIAQELATNLVMSAVQGLLAPRMRPKMPPMPAQPVTACSSRGGPAAIGAPWCTLPTAEQRAAALQLVMDNYRKELVVWFTQVLETGKGSFIRTAEQELTRNGIDVQRVYRELADALGVTPGDLSTSTAAKAAALAPDSVAASVAAPVAPTQAQTQVYVVPPPPPPPPPVPVGPALPPAAVTPVTVAASNTAPATENKNFGWLAAAIALGAILLGGGYSLCICQL